VRLFKWTRMHAVFIPEIDAEHQNIFRLADELHQAVVGGAPADQAQAILRELIASSEAHFGREERLMRSTHYLVRPGTKSNMTRCARGSRNSRRHRGRRRPGALLLLEFLSGWLRDHVVWPIA